MPRRRKEDFFDLLIDCPWWLSIIFAVFAYAGAKYGLPWYAQDNRILSGMAKGISPLALYFTFPFLLIAVVAFIRSFSRRALLNRQTGLESIRSLSWRDFERLCGEAFLRRGYAVKENGLGGADGGIDLILSKNGETHLVQCKHWKKSKVGVKDIRELFGIVMAEHAASGIFIATDHFTQDARAFADDKPLDLINGAALVDLIGLVNPQANPLPATPEPLPMKETQKPVSPVCPRCGDTMQLKTAQRGQYKGKPFWGCTNYPACRGIVNVN